MASLRNPSSRFKVPGYLVGPLVILIIAMIYGSLGSEYFLDPASIVLTQVDILKLVC
jgi:hypothetical protein